MGWEQREMRIVGRVSRHNSVRDKVDDLLWADVQARIRKVIEDSQYESLTLMEA